MKVASLSRPMLRLSFNRPMLHQRCPICNLTTGKLVRQKEALHQLGYLGAVDAHLVCVADAQEAKQ
jgi:hypothetical protein